jgi:hypothetical protein
VKIPGFQCFHLEKIKKTKHLKKPPPFGPFWENPAKIRPQICLAAYIFIQHLFSFAAEQSASWEH